MVIYTPLYVTICLQTKAKNDAIVLLLWYAQPHGVYIM